MKNLILLTVMILLFTSSKAFSVEVNSNLRGLLINQSGVTIQVASGGCTSKQSFEVQLLESDPVQLQFNKVRPDRCRAYLPYGTTIHYTFEELGLKEGDRFTVANPITGTYSVR